MRVVLLADVKGSGHRDEVVEVKDGYARNYLIPKGLARIATEHIEREISQKKAREQRKQAEERAKVEAKAQMLSGKVVEVKARVGESGRLFGTVTNSDVAAALALLGVTLDRHKISFEAIKHVGDFPAILHLYPGIETQIIVRVVAQ